MGRSTRQHNRETVDFQVVLYWEDPSGQVHSIRPQARDVSPAGMCLESDTALEAGTEVYLDVPRYGVPVEAVVRYCVASGEAFRVGVEFSVVTKRSVEPIPQDIDCYEVLQLSAKAEMETIHRVYRIMAARFHPDNPESGDKEKFMLLTEAYRVLSDPERRAQYDALRSSERPGPLPLFQARAFVDDREGEANRRLGVLCLLYAQRRRDTEHPAIGLLALESLMSIPREYLEFTLWYLKQKRYVEITEGADFSLTADGVDFVEENAPTNAMLLQLLQRAGSSAQHGQRPHHQERIEAVRLQ
jgi:hypothetical protein